MIFQASRRVTQVLEKDCRLQAFIESAIERFREVVPDATIIPRLSAATGKPRRIFLGVTSAASEEHVSQKIEEFIHMWYAYQTPLNARVYFYPARYLTYNAEHEDSIEE